MQVIVVVLNKLDCLDDLLANLKRAGVRGGTIIEYTGMIKTIDDSVGGIDNPNTGIVFGLPLTFADGLIKK